jgi:hypothetical protein
MNYKVEIEECRIGFVEVERLSTATGWETLSHMRERAKEAVEDGVLLPVWEQDEIEVSADPGSGLRCYDVDAPCAQKAGWMTSYCGTHEEPMLEGLDTCQRRVDDLAQREDENQERLW